MSEQPYNSNQFLKAIDTWRNLLDIVDYGAVEFASNEPDEAMLKELVLQMRDAVRTGDFTHCVAFWHGDVGIEFKFSMRPIERNFEDE